MKRPQGGGTVMASFEEAVVHFWERVEKQSGDGCWLWTRSRAKSGYGTLKFQGRHEYTHRLAWRLQFGEIPDGKWVLHRCDVRNCVRGDHLFLGDVVANVRDMVEKGRHGSTVKRASRPRGEAHRSARLTTASVAAIRAAAGRGETTSTIAAAHRVARSTIDAVVSKKTWSHIP